MEYKMKFNFTKSKLKQPQNEFYFSRNYLNIYKN